MKVIILAGGWGTRLGKQTETIPKPMVKIGDKPIIWHILKYFSFYDINDFIISCGVKSEVIKEYFTNYNRYINDTTVNLKTGKVLHHTKNVVEDWNITLADTGLNTLKGARIKRVEKYLHDEINMITYGDGLSNINIHDLLSYHKKHGKLLTISGVKPSARFGEIIEKDGRIISFEEKPQTSSGIINGGFMVFNKKLLNYLTDDENCDFEYDTIEKLVREDEVMVYKHGGDWECMDHDRDVEHLNKLWKSNNAFWKVWGGINE